MTGTSFIFHYCSTIGRIEMLGRSLARGTETSLCDKKTGQIPIDCSGFGLECRGAKQMSVYPNIIQLQSRYSVLRLRGTGKNLSVSLREEMGKYRP